MALTTAKVADAVLNLTLVAPVSLVPVMVTVTRYAPDVGVKLVMVGPVGSGAGDVTVKPLALTPVPPAVVTAIVPLVAPVGTVALISVSPTTVNAAAVPLNLTALAPVNFVPVTVTEAPTRPEAGANPVTVGASGPGVTAAVV